ncbi:MAG: type II toxin-antitoxin system VapC family toxin [Sphingomonas sp.]
MTAYPDASIIVSAFSEERFSDTARAWIAALAPGELVTSKWCMTEVASAMAIKSRTGALKAADFGIVIDAVNDLLAQSAAYLPVEAASFDLATTLIRRSSKPLRSGDALHLAVGSANGATVWTFDHAMAAAGQALGIDARLLT